MNSRNRFKVEQFGGDLCDFEAGTSVNDAFTLLDPDDYPESQRELVEEFNRRAEAGNQRYRISMYRAEMFEKGFNAGMYICTFDHDENMTSFVFTDETRRLLGYDSQEDLPNSFDSWVKTLLPDQRDVMVPIFWNTVKGHRQLPDISHAEYQMMRKDGRIIWVTGAGRFIRRADGTLEIYMGCYRDVTAEHEKDDYLHVIEGIGKVFNFSLYIDMSNETYQIVSTNEYVERVRKDPNAFQFLRDNVDSSVHPDYKAEMKDWLRSELVSSLLTVKETISKDFYSAGADRWFRGIFMAADKNGDGSPAHVIYGCQDITYEKKHELRRKADLEVSVARQMAQIDEIKALNASLLEEQKAKEREHAVVDALSASYLNVYVINTAERTVEILKLNGYVTGGLSKANSGPYPYEATCGAYISKRVYPEDQRSVAECMSLENLLTQLKDKKEYEFTYRVPENGGVSYYQGKYVAVDGGYIVCGFQNIDEIVKKEREQKEELTAAYDRLADSNAVLRKQYQIMSTLGSDYTNVFLIDTSDGTSRAITLRQDTENLLGVGKQEKHIYQQAIDRYTSSSRIHPEDTAFMTENMRLEHVIKELEDKKEFSGNFRVIDNDTTHYYQFKYRKVPDTQYVLLGFQNTDMLMEDEIRRNDELQAHIKEITALNRSLDDYNSIMSSTGYGMWHIILKDGAAPRMKANDKMRELLGVTGQDLSEEEMYSAWYDRIVPEAIPSVQASVGEMLNGSFSENTYQWVHPTKGRIYVRCGGTASRRDSGVWVLGGYHADVTDIVYEEQKHNEELEKAKKDAEAANNAKTSFLFNMSHDIRTPMNAIIGFRDLLERHQDDPEKRKDYLGKIQESSTVLLSIINNVLEMARIEKGTLEIDETAWSAEQFYDTLYSVFHVMMEQKGLKFTRQFDIQHHYVYCDPTKLREIFINILSNAYKYTNAGGSVNMRLEELPSDREGWVLYRTTVTDTGIGMSEEFLPHIFDEFSREKNTTEAKVEGTGLGMPIVKRLVDMLGGTIEVKSRKGEGSAFIVTIPHRMTEKSSLVQRAGVEVDPELFKGKRILLAEDNDLNAEIAIEILTEAGFIVERAEDGAVCVDMLKAAEARYYDLILMDIQMPNMNGYEATRAIRQLEDSVKADIRIIAMTANAFEEDKREALKSGMNGHLAKPINAHELMRTLAGILISM